MKSLRQSARAVGGAIATLVIGTMLAAPRPAAAQVYTGRIDISVSDSTARCCRASRYRSPDPRVTKRSPTRRERRLPQSRPRDLSVKASLAGFGDYLNQTVPVATGSIVPLRATLAVAGVAEQVTVQAETPAIDPKRVAISTNVTLDELEKVPSSRDPWVVLQTVPGIVVDRVNVGGSESGQQSNYAAQGADFGDNTWYLDGVPITDMNALGSSPTYYDFDMFQEIQVTTGGADPLAATAGVQLYFVLRSGTNDLHGANLVTRQGYGKPYHVNDVLTNDPVRTFKDVLVIDDLDANRLPTVTSFDLRFQKAVRLSRSNLEFDLDIFNVFNAATVLGRQYDVEATGTRGFDSVLEIMNPRIVRLGLRVTF